MALVRSGWCDSHELMVAVGVERSQGRKSMAPGSGPWALAGFVLDPYRPAGRCLPRALGAN